MRTPSQVLEVIKKIAQQQELSLSELSRRSGISKSAISRYFDGSRKFPLDKIFDFSKALGVSSEFLLGVKNIDDFQPVEKIKKIPLIGSIACGDPLISYQNIDGYIDEPADNLPGGTLFYLKANGDSMYPTILDGSHVLIRQQNEIEDGEIAAVLFLKDFSTTLKRIKKVDNKIILIPDNPKYCPIIADENNPIKILGKAIKITIDL